MKSVVIIPTYNEKDNMRPLVRAILAVHSSIDVLIVDDGSPDGTGEAADSLSQEQPRVRVLHRTGARGRGLAGLDGFRRASAEKYELIMEMDGDFSHDPADITRILEAMSGADLVIGSRFINGGRDLRSGSGRRFISRIANAVSRMILGIPVKDCTSGYRCFKRPLLEKLLERPLISKGPSVVEELLYRAVKNGAKVVELPIHFHDRKKGRSKLDLRKMIEVFLVILCVRLGFQASARSDGTSL